MSIKKLAAYCGLYCGDCELGNSEVCAGCTGSCGHTPWGDCEVARCAMDRGHEHCGECPEFPCAKLKEYSFDPEYGDNGARIRNLEEWKRMGFEAWLAARNAPRAKPDA